MSWLDKLRTGLAKTRTALTGSIRGVFGNAQDPEEILESIEETLITGDLGVRFADEMVEDLREDISEGKLDAEGVLGRVKVKLETIFAEDHGPMKLDEASPAIILIVGVNGVGKTTTCAKLAARFQAYGRKPILVAGDTFRAGAIEQLKVWGERLDVPVIAGKPGSDPSSLAYDACAKAKGEGYDMVLMDTAGRLHTQFNLMKELEKIGKVMKKVVPGAPHETFLVLDATTGQNAFRQAEEFSKIVPVSGLVVTKLDGSAKGGCVVPVIQDLDVPIRFIGVGEAVDDLDNFRADEFVDALFSELEGEAASA